MTSYVRIFIAYFLERLIKDDISPEITRHLNMVKSEFTIIPHEMLTIRIWAELYVPVKYFTKK